MSYHSWKKFYRWIFIEIIGFVQNECFVTSHNHFFYRILIKDHCSGFSNSINYL